MSFMEENTKIWLENIVEKDADKEYSIKLKTNFNFRDGKLTANDISEITLTQNQFNIAPLANFCGFKALELNAMDQNPVVIPSKTNFQVFGVTHLKIYDRGNLKNMDRQLFSRFPDLESLATNKLILNDGDFRSICEHMPKLKELFCDKYNEQGLEISVKTVFSEDYYSIKDLSNLETFWITTKPEIVDASDLNWPSLPHMKILHMRGEGLQSLSQNFYSQIAQKSPKLRDIYINYIKYPEMTPSKFFPLLPKLKLVDLGLPRIKSEENNSELVENIVKHCKHLKNFKIYGLSLQQEIHLLKNLPKLYLIGCNKFRKDFEDLKKYLANNILSYKNLEGTINYLYNFEIPYEDRLRMEESFEAEFADEFDGENFKMWYIVMNDYLKMSRHDMCKAFYLRNRQD